MKIQCVSLFCAHSEEGTQLFSLHNPMFYFTKAQKIQKNVDVEVVLCRLYVQNQTLALYYRAGEFVVEV